MSDQPRERSPYLPVVAGLPCLVVLYVLSIGPVVWVFDRVGWQHPDWKVAVAEAVYTPLFFLADATGSDDWLDWYIDWFAGRGV